MNADPNKFSKSSKLNWEASNRAIKRFNEQDIAILNKYYLTSYGNYEDLKAIREFAEQNGIDPSKAWETIKLANYEVAVERGLIDRKEVTDSAVVQCDSPGP